MLYFRYKSFLYTYIIGFFSPHVSVCNYFYHPKLFFARHESDTFTTVLFIGNTIMPRVIALYYHVKKKLLNLKDVLQQQAGDYHQDLVA